jgi:hypothetical protein
MEKSDLRKKFFHGRLELNEEIHAASLKEIREEQDKKDEESTRYQKEWNERADRFLKEQREEEEKRWNSLSESQQIAEIKMSISWDEMRLREVESERRRLLYNLRILRKAIKEVESPTSTNIK